MKKSKLYNLFLILVGTVFGSFITTLCKDIRGFSWISYGAVFGMSSPLELRLGVVDLTFGVSINLTLATIICIILSLLIGRAIVK